MTTLNFALTPYAGLKELNRLCWGENRVARLQTETRLLQRAHSANAFPHKVKRAECFVLGFHFLH